MTADSTTRRAPVGRPTRRDLAFAALLAAWAIWRLATTDVIVWPATVVGLVLFAIAARSVATTSVGAGAGSWFRDIGVPGRVIVIVAFAALASSALTALNVPTAAAASFARGSVLGVVAIVGLEGIRSRGAVE